MPSGDNSISGKVALIENIITIPTYSLVGYTSGFLAYSSTVEGVIDLWALNLEKGVSARLTTGGIHQVARPRPQSPYLIYTRDVSRGRELQKVYAVHVAKGEELELEVFEPRRVLGIAFDGRQVALAAAGEGMELWLLDLKGGAEKLHATNGIMWVTDFADGLIVGQGVLRGNPRAYEIFIYDLASRTFSIYTPKEGSTNKSPVTSGGKVLFATNAFGGEQLVVYDRESRELEAVKFGSRDLDAYRPIEFPDFGWTWEGKVWAIGKREGRSKLFLDGKVLPTPEGLVVNADFAGAKAYATHTSLTVPPRILELDGSGWRVLLGSELPGDVRSRFGDAYMVKVKSYDGVEVPTFVAESRAAPKPGPTVVYVHGGPWSEVADAWNRFIAALVVSGYHVVAPNFRGSTGYGEEFRAMDVGDPGGGDLEDVVKAAEWARNEGLASRVAVMGYSYGGFMTFLATVKKPDTFDAGVAGAGIVNWEEMRELSDAFFRNFIDVLFAGKLELLKDRSAVNFAENLKVPLCIIHPQNDTRTPLKPVLRYIWRLMELGKTFEVHIVPDMGHAIVRLDDALKLLMPAVIFLDRYLR